jgi:ketosteroid isomerase-like protein
MTDVIAQMVVAMNRHDLDGAASLMHEDYRSEQPVHPSQAFVGRAQMRANWESMFAGIPDFQAELCRSARDGDTTWCEWRWSGTHTDGRPFEARGVTLFEIRDGQVVAGRLYMEDLDREAVSIEQAVQARTGRRPQLAPEQQVQGKRPDRD